MRRMVGLVGLCLWVVFPVAAAQQNSGNVATATVSQTKVCTEGAQLADLNPEYEWRFRAYENLDCAMAILDEALKAQGKVVMLSREQAEQARARVWAARDAAARIGR